jgi:hypothetical protein
VAAELVLRRELELERAQAQVVLVVVVVVVVVAVPAALVPLLAARWTKARLQKK